MELIVQISDKKITLLDTKEVNMKQDSRFEILWMIFLTLSSYQAFHVEEMDQECSSYWVKQFSGCFNDTEEIGHWKFCIQRESCVISSPLAFYNDTVFESHLKKSHSTLRAKRATFTF